MFRKTSLESFDSSNAVIHTAKEYYDYLCKIIMVGPTNSGKSSILHRFMNQEWSILKSQTIGVEFVSKIITIGDNSLLDLDGLDSSIKMKLQVWDTAGQERFRSLTRSYYRGSAGVILTFDITSRDSFFQLSEFMMDIKNLTEESVSVILVANKVDLIESFVSSGRDSELVSKDEIQFFIDKFQGELDTHIQLIYASALTNENITELFEKLGCSILTKIELGELNPESVNSGVQYGNLIYDLSSLSISHDLSFGYGSINNNGKNNKNSKQKAITLLKRKQSLTLDLVNGGDRIYTQGINDNNHVSNGTNGDDGNSWFTCCSVQ